MKKLMLIFVLLISSLTQMYAQDTISYILPDVPTSMQVCCGTVIAIYTTETSCDDWGWWVNNVSHGQENPLILQSQVEHLFRVEYGGCDIAYFGNIGYVGWSSATPLTCNLWKRFGETMTIEPVGTDSLTWFDYLWSTGATTSTIDVTEPGTYTCQITDFCGTATRTFIVRDNSEITLATCDLESNLNMVTWQTTPAQAEYIDHVIIKRDGMQVGTAPYTDGQFIDNIGSGAASRTYTITAVATDGTQCPIVSYPKETIHMAYLTGINNTIEVNWNIPTGYDLLGYNICKYTPGSKDGDLTVIDFVGASVTSYTCSESQFDEGYIVVQGVEAGKDNETRLLSNRSTDLVGIGEKEKQNFNIYPNPSAGRVTIEGTGRLTITNVLGQAVLTRDITETETLDLPSGVWFVKLDGTTRKVVVE